MPDNTLLIVLIVLAALCLLVAVPVYAMVRATEQGHDRWAAGLAFSIFVPPVSLLLATFFLVAGTADVQAVTPAKTATGSRSSRDGDEIWTWLSVAAVLVFVVLGWALRK